MRIIKELYKHIYIYMQIKKHSSSTRVFKWNSKFTHAPTFEDLLKC